jgi:filamentous hemagglutinin family protein
MKIDKQLREALLNLAFYCLLLPSASAQVSPDGTTATDVNSSDGQNFDIGGGDRAGGNLFHSFGRFSVPGGGSANFLNSPDIQNIISRVTGGNISTIDGLIKANGSANLFLVNPAGISFGANASLNIGGSFLGSTADSLLFSDGTEFSAKDFNKPLLTINAPIGLNIRDNPAPIINNSNVGLQVNSGQNITLVGGNLDFDRSKITAPGGRVELISLFGAGKIDINENGSLTLPEGIARGDINLNNESEINVRGSGGGSIDVNAKNLTLSGGSELLAGIEEDRGSPEAKAGDITINATDSVNLLGRKTTSPVVRQENEEQRIIEQYDGTAIRNNVGVPSSRRGDRTSQSTAVGNGGNIVINTNNLQVSDVANIDTSLFGKGEAGDININAKNVSIEGDGSWLLSQVKGENFDRIKEKAIGNAGDININTASLRLNNYGWMFVNTASDTQGNSGNITINATDAMSMDNNSRLLTQIGANSTGNAGNIAINTSSLSLNNKSDILTTIFGKANAGNVIINAKDNVSLDRESNIFSAVYAGGVGNGGNIDITTGSFSANGKALLFANTQSQGNAGNIKLKASDRVTFDGGSLVLSQVNPGAVGNGGNIDINAGSFTATNASLLLASTDGKGNAGNVSIKAKDNITFDKGGLVITSAFNNGVGNAGSIDINTGSLTLKDRSELLSFNLGQGNGGNVNITATGNVSFEQASEIVTFLTSKSNLAIKAGDINIAADSVSLQDFSLFSASNNSEGIGKAGNITVKTNNMRVANGAAIGADTQNNQTGGDVKIDAQNLDLASGGKIITGSNSTGNAGNITLNIANNINFDGSNPVSSSQFKEVSTIFKQPLFQPIEAETGLFANTTPNATGNGGNISVTVPGNISILNGGKIAVDSQGRGNGGSIALKSNSLTLDRNASILASTKFGEGGNINLQVKDILSLRDRSKISAQASENANGGNITIDAPNGFIVAPPNQNSDILAIAEKGKGGNININTQGVFGLRERKSTPPNNTNDIDASSEFGFEGSVVITNPDTNPTKGLEQSTTNLVAPDETVASACSSDGSGTIANSFSIIGRGGMPEDPTKPLNAIVIAGDSGESGIGNRESGVENRNKNNATFSSDEIIPARGVAVNAKGQIVLTRYPTPKASDRPLVPFDRCNSSLPSEKYLAMEKQSDRSEEILDDETVKELMDFLYKQH